MKEKKKLKEKTYLFSGKILAEVFGADNIAVTKIKFAEMIKAPNKSKAFKEVQRRIKEKLRRRGYYLKNDRENGYRVQYHINGSFRKLWEKTAP